MTAITPGYYRARATEAVLGRANSGYEQVVITFQITEPGEFEGAQIRYFGSFHPNARQYTVEALETCGYQGEDDLSSVTKLEVSLNVVNEEYNGKFTTKVAFVNKTGAIAVRNQLNDTEARDFVKRLGATVRAARAGRGASPNTSRPASKGSPHAPPRGATHPQASAPIDALPEDDADNIPF
jgi:hypothetical protein